MFLGCVTVAAIKNRRNAVCLVASDDEEFLVRRELGLVVAE